mmetsp:Transcript_24874/g.57343  ORF Transcript_24874/g.57343 Transcript_24874/m.57343 type:complete len:218 (+) Transcript_24874:1775-2428(+)
MFSDLLEVGQSALLTLENRAHASQGGAFQTLASVKGVTVFHHADHVAGDGVHRAAGGVDLAQCQFVVVAVIQSVAQIRVERMDVIQTGKLGKDGGQTFTDGLLCEFYFANVETADTRYFVTGMYHGRRSPLRSRKDDVHQISRGRDSTDRFKIVNWHIYSDDYFYLLRFLQHEKKLKYPSLCSVIDASELSGTDNSPYVLLKPHCYFRAFVLVNKDQ